MKKWNLLGQTSAPDGTIISLYEHDGDYALRAGSAELMSTRQHGSEEKLAELACAHVRAIRNARILVGGLGFGFTLKATLAAVDADAAVVVAEILPAVIEWNRNPDFHLAADALADPRVTVRPQDVVEVIRQTRHDFDSIILDVDNGPDAISTAANHRLYSPEGLKAIRAALRPGGCAAFWSAASDEAFERQLARSGFTVEVHRVRAHGKSGTWRTLFLGQLLS